MTDRTPKRQATPRRRGGASEPELRKAFGTKVAEAIKLGQDLAPFVVKMERLVGSSLNTVMRREGSSPSAVDPARLDAEPPRPRPRPTRGRRRPPTEPSWRHADVFPIIARVIEGANRESQRFVTADEIATKLLKHAEARNLLQAARKLQEEKQSLAWLASNMVAWFSQRITVGQSKWKRGLSGRRLTVGGRINRSLLPARGEYAPRAAYDPAPIMAAIGSGIRPRGSRSGWCIGLAERLLRWRRIHEAVR